MCGDDDGGGLCWLVVVVIVVVLVQTQAATVWSGGVEWGGEKSKGTVNLRSGLVPIWHYLTFEFKKGQARDPYCVTHRSVPLTLSPRENAGAHISSCGYVSLYIYMSMYNHISTSISLRSASPRHPRRRTSRMSDPERLN
jgi:hypothetical protein